MRINKIKNIVPVGIFLLLLFFLLTGKGFSLKKNLTIANLSVISRPESTTFFSYNKNRYFNYCSSQEAISKAGTQGEHGKCSWAWLKDGKFNLVVKELLDYYLEPEGNEMWHVTGTAYRPPQVMYFLVKLQGKVPTETIEKIKERAKAFHEQGASKNPNGAIQIMVADYLYAEYFDRNLPYHCANNDRWCSFTYNGRTYKNGKTYNTYQLAKDFLSYEIENFVKKDRATRLAPELDSPTYTWSFLNGLLMLYETTKDIQLKKMAKMALDMFFLDTGTNCIIEDGYDTACTSPINRNYPSMVKEGRIFFPWKHYFYKDHNFRNWPPFDSLYVSEYKISPSILDVINKKNEGNDYVEYVSQSILSSNGNRQNGKSSLTKNWAMGASILGGNSLVIKSAKNPFMVFINNSVKINKKCLYDWTNFGRYSIFYKNALFISDSKKLHAQFLLGNNSFDRGQDNLKKVTDSICGQENPACRGGYKNTCADYTLKKGSRWNYFLKGNVALAIRVEDNFGAMEVSTICPSCEYKSFQAFKNASRRLSSYCFKTGLGDNICKRYITTGKGGMIGYVNEKDYPSTTERLSIKDKYGNKIVDWNNNVMTVSKNGKKCIYNFNNWTMSGNGCSNTNMSIPIEKISDFNCDEQINVQDFIILISRWKKTDNIENYQNANCSTTKNLDLYKDGKIDIRDLGILLSSWGK